MKKLNKTLIINILFFTVPYVCPKLKNCELISVNANTQGRSVARCPEPVT